MIMNLIIVYKFRHELATGLKVLRQVRSIWGENMVARREELRHDEKLTQTQEEVRSKLASNIRNKVPMGLLGNFKDEEIIAMLADKDLIRGTFVIADEAGKALGTLGDFFGKLFVKEKKEAPEKEQIQGLYEVKT